MNTIKLNTIGELTPSAEGGSSGGGGGSNSNSNIIYLDVRNFRIYLEQIVRISILTKYKMDDYIGIDVSSNIVYNIGSNTLTVFAVSIDLGLKLKDVDGVFTIQDIIVNDDYFSKFFESIPRLTEEEFYNLNV